MSGQRILRSNRSRVASFSGTFAPAGTSSVTGEANTAQATVARTGTGKIKVTFPEFYRDYYGATAKLNATGSSYAIVDSFTKGSTTTPASMVIGTYGASNVAADIASASNVTVTWSATVRT